MPLTSAFKPGYVTNFDVNLEDRTPYLCGWPKFARTAAVGIAVAPPIGSRLSVVCNVCVVAKRCVLPKKLYEEANKKWPVANQKCVPDFIIIGTFSLKYAIHNDFHISDSPPSWISDGVIILHPVIDFRGPKIFTTNGLVVSVQDSCATATDRQADRQTVTQTDIAVT